jgi:hypothetical protein
MTEDDTSPDGPPDGTCLVIHRNSLIAQDLAEILRWAGWTGCKVSRIAAIGASPGRMPRIVVADMTFEAMAASDQGRNWLAAGTPIVLLAGLVPRPRTDREGVFYLEEPFRTEDAARVLAMARDWRRG